jgi:sulfide:quinone oxidoreductase
MGLGERTDSIRSRAAYLGFTSMGEVRGQLRARRRDLGKQRVLIAGGGVAALEAMLALHHLAADALATTLVCPRDSFEYRPLAVAQPFDGHPPPRFELGRLLSERGAGHVRDAVASVDPASRSVQLEGGDRLGYDFLLLAPGARPVVGVPGATHFWANAGAEDIRSLVSALENGAVRDVAVAVPGGVTWPLPAYELVLQVARRRNSAGAGGRVLLVTPERAPLEAFGRRIGAAVHDLLHEREVAIVTDTTPEQYVGHSLSLAGGGTLRADRAIALPRLRGPALGGIPHDAHGFIPVDARARVEGVERVWAAGDATTFPVKQGGVAAHQADAAAQSIALAAGVAVDPTPFRPVLRGVLITGGAPLYMRRRLLDPADPDGDGAALATHPFWWPPDKIAARYLAPFLSAMAARAPAARAAV